MTRGDKIIIHEQMVYKNEIYKHHKGDNYKIILTAEESNTGEIMVVYQAMYENPDYPYFTLPVVEFTKFVEKDGQKIKRFTKIN